MNIILVTGCAGFIGSHTCEYLLKKKINVYGIDNLNNYYDVKLKLKNLEILKKYSNFFFYKEDIYNTQLISKIKPDKIIHLAAMAGVRYSIENPKIYIKNNIECFIHILEECVKNNINHIIYASSSSVYGLNKKVPFSELDELKEYNSQYALSKLCMEQFANLYNKLYGLTCIGLRFFTVYGPRGRPDMAPYKFLNSIKNKKQFTKYGDGTTSRDYTYIDDIVEGIVQCLYIDKKCEIYNLGNSVPISLNRFIEICEKITNNKAVYKQINNQIGDVPHTYADITKAKRDLNYNPKVNLEEGLKKLYETL